MAEAALRTGEAAAPLLAVRDLQAGTANRISCTASPSTSRKAKS